MNSKISINNLMKCNINSITYYEHMLKNLLNKYEFKNCSERTIFSIREDIQIVVRYANVCNVDINKLFPVIIDHGGGILLKFYQNGEVYTHGSNNITCLHGSYEDDSICL